MSIEQLQSWSICQIRHTTGKLYSVSSKDTGSKPILLETLGLSVDVIAASSALCSASAGYQRLTN